MIMLYLENLIKNIDKFMIVPPSMYFIINTLQSEYRARVRTLRSQKDYGIPNYRGTLYVWRESERKVDEEGEWWNVADSSIPVTKHG